MKLNWQNIKLADIFRLGTVILICLVCCSAMSFLMPYRIFLIGFFGLLMYLTAYMKNDRLIMNPLSILMLAFILMCTAGMTYSLNMTETLKYSLVYLCMLPIILFDIDRSFYQRVLNGIKTITFFIACSIILNSIFPRLFLNTLNFLIKPGLKSWLRIEIANHIYSGLAGEKGEAAMLMVVGMAIAVSEYVKDKKITVKKMIYTLVIAAALVLPAKRMLFAIGIFFMIFYILFWTNKSKKMISIAFGLLALAIVILFADYIPGLNTLLERYINGRVDLSMNGRSYLWERAIQMFRRRPILGYGYGSYNTFASFYGVRTSGSGEWLFYAHNVYLQLLGETGIIGAAMMFGMMLYSACSLITLHMGKVFIQAEDMAILAFSECMLICFFIYNITGNCLYSTNQITLFMFTFACVMYLIRKTGKRGENIEKS